MAERKGTHWNVVVLPSFMWRCNVSQVLDDFFSVFCLSSTWFPSAKENYN